MHQTEAANVDRLSPADEALVGDIADVILARCEIYTPEPTATTGFDTVRQAIRDAVAKHRQCPAPQPPRVLVNLDFQASVHGQVDAERLARALNRLAALLTRAQP